VTKVCHDSLHPVGCNNTETADFVLFSMSKFKHDPLGTFSSVRQEAFGCQSCRKDVI
jgi:hypothetical protein